MFFTILSIFFACEPKEEEIFCTADIKSSALLDLQDQNGNPIIDAEVSYAVDGVEGTFVESWSNGQYVLGEEEAGDFVVDIFVEVPTDDSCCWDVGTATLEFTIEMDENECHVVTQTFEPELEWALACADVDENGDC